MRSASLRTRPQALRIQSREGEIRNRGGTPGVIPNMNDSNGHRERAGDDAEDKVEQVKQENDAPKIVVDPTLLEDEEKIEDERIRVLLREAATGGRESTITRMCTAALESKNPTIRSLARRGCAELWTVRLAKLKERRPPRLDRLYQEDPEDADLSVGDTTAIIALLTETPVGFTETVHDRPSIARPRIHIPLPVDPLPVEPSLPLVEFPCPLCRRPISGEEDEDALRIPPHLMHVPVFPFGTEMPPYLLRCPASEMELFSLYDVCVGYPSPSEDAEETSSTEEAPSEEAPSQGEEDEKDSRDEEEAEGEVPGKEEDPPDARQILDAEGTPNDTNEEASNAEPTLGSLDYDMLKVEIQRSEWSLAERTVLSPAYQEALHTLSRGPR